MTTTQPLSPEVVEAAFKFLRNEDLTEAEIIHLSAKAPLWGSDKTTLWAYNAARILAAEVERLRAQADAVCASDWRLSKGAEENPSDGTIVGECSGGQFVVFAPSKIPIYCPGCGRKVKITTNDNKQ